jgi:hypothetical protein
MLNKSSCHNGIYTALKDANNALRSIACDELGLEGGKKFEKCMMNEMVWPRAVVLMSDSRKRAERGLRTEKKRWSGDEYEAEETGMANEGEEEKDRSQIFLPFPDGAESW